jgi:hypothetical protein
MASSRKWISHGQASPFVSSILIHNGKKDGPFNVLDSVPTGPDCTNWRWRTEIDLRDSAKLVLTRYGIGPEGLEWKGVGFNYQKTIE